VIRGPAARPASPADRSAQPTVEVRHDGLLIKRIAPGAAEELVGREWAQWIGTGRRRYIRLSDTAPLSCLHGWTGGNHTTRAARAGGSLRRAAGQRLGYGPATQEHRA
jgi:hypothetical protein